MEKQEDSHFRRMMHIVVKALTAIELGFGILALVTIFVLIFFQALQRYLPIEQAAWTGEISRFALVWITFVCAGILVTTRGHISLEILDSLHSKIAVRVVHVVSHLILAAVGVGLAIAAWDLITTQGILKSPVLRIPMSYVYIPVLVGLVSLVLRSLLVAWQSAVYGPTLHEIDDDTDVAAAS